jgi:DNA-binding HxlR family transcriptional regulator
MRRHREFCPYFQQAVELLGRRWTGAVLRALLGGPLRFSQIERAVPAISARALALRLRQLEAAGLVVRGVDPGIPVRVTYRLTRSGRALEDVVARIEHWAHGWLAPQGPPPHIRAGGRGDGRRPAAVDAASGSRGPAARRPAR